MVRSWLLGWGALYARAVDSAYEGSRVSSSRRETQRFACAPGDFFSAISTAPAWSG